MTTAVLPETETLSPPLKWAGGKRWLVPHLVTYWSRHRDARLVEPFCGGLAVTLGLMPQRALLNDINPHLMNFYCQVQGGLFISKPWANNEEVYYGARRRFNDLIAWNKADNHEAAELFWYLNRTGYNGLCRFNSKGEYNVPFGKYKTINYNRDFGIYRETFARWRFTCVSFEKALVCPGDFVYADPPYDVPFTHYSAGGFGWQDQIKTAEWLARHDGPVLLSNQATPRIVELYSDLKYEIRLMDAPRRISCTGDRAPAPEVLATRNL